MCRRSAASPAASTSSTPTTRRDTFGSGADRHANFGQGHLPADEFAGVVREAGAPVVCETPGGATEHQADFAWLREHL